MKNLAYYNELEKYPAQWLRNLIENGYIAKGYVDQKDIREVEAVDILHYRQAHFFAGIGTWSYALKLAGWPDDHEVWTGSCPCQPFSSAGKRRGTDDPRHLWPEWFRLIKECRPAVVFGEQVASQDGLKWLDIVQTDLENEGYAVGAVDLCAAGTKAPHIRQRIYFVAHTQVIGERRLPIQPRGPLEDQSNPARNGEIRSLSDTNLPSPPRQQQYSRERKTEKRILSGSGINCKPGNTTSEGFQDGDEEKKRTKAHEMPERPGTTGFWDNAEWLYYSDGYYRPTEPGIFPLAHGASQRMGRLRAYGNAIVAPLAAEFIKSYMEVINQ